jgi:hypothetical protein
MFIGLSIKTSFPGQKISHERKASVLIGTIFLLTLPCGSTLPAIHQLLFPAATIFSVSITCKCVPTGFSVKIPVAILYIKTVVFGCTCFFTGIGNTEEITGLLAAKNGNV